MARTWQSSVLARTDENSVEKRMELPNDQYEGSVQRLVRLFFSGIIVGFEFHFGDIDMCDYFCT